MNEDQKIHDPDALKKLQAMKEKGDETIRHTHKNINRDGPQRNEPMYSHERWRGLLEETFQKAAELSSLKGAEYSGDFDRLANFRRNAKDTETTKEHVWRIYAGKHWDAITQYINDEKAGRDRRRLESISGRIDDMIVYLILLKAMIEENEGKT